MLQVSVVTINGKYIIISIIIIIIIIITTTIINHIHFTAVQLVLKRVRGSLTDQNFLFAVLSEGF